MIYLKANNGQSVIVLEFANFDELKKGRPAKTPDGTIWIAGTPDPAWLQQQLIAHGAELDAPTVVRLIEEAGTRPEQPLRAPFDPQVIRFKR